MTSGSRYSQLMQAIFFDHYTDGDISVPFRRDEIVSKAQELSIDLPLNLGDVVYSFRYRTPLPETILATEPEGMSWVIIPAGRSLYRFELRRQPMVLPDTQLAAVKVPDATPGIIQMYAAADEQALLAKLRYNRLIDIFLGLTCYSLQNHLRTTVEGFGQVETDEIYVGLDKHGAHYIVPVQAKGGTDSLSLVQIEQDMALCAEKFSDLHCTPVAAQFMDGDEIALFSFGEIDGEVKKMHERHYRLVPPSSLSAEELRLYSHQPPAL
jgi:hypothetical protein